MKLYLVGGTVRRHMLGLPKSTDLDFAVEADSYLEMFRRIRDDHNGIIWQEREEFVTLRARIDVHALDFDGIIDRSVCLSSHVNADFTLCRKETQYSDKRHPDTVTPTTIHEDLKRRDFTVNAVAVDQAGEWIDPHGGVHDAENQVLRCVGHPEDRMEEDPLRILRAVRFSITEDLLPDDGINRVLFDPIIIEKMKSLPVERIREELNKTLRHDWLRTVHALDPYIGPMLRANYPELWFKATEEGR